MFGIGHPINRLEGTKAIVNGEVEEPDHRSSVRSVPMSGLSTADRGSQKSIKRDYRNMSIFHRSLVKVARSIALKELR